MDDLDFALVRQLAHPQTLQWNIRPSYGELARAVGADEERVRLRVLRMQEDQVIAGWEIAVHPALLGRGMVRFDLPPTPGRKDAVAAQLANLDGARLLFEYHGDRLAFVSYEEAQARERRVALLSALAGGPPRVAAMGLPPPTVAPDRDDWRIIHALRQDAKATQAAIAAATGLSARTVARRLEALTAGRALYLNPEVDFTRYDGVPCTICVRHGAASPRAAIDDYLRQLPRIGFQWFEGDESRVSFAVRNLIEVEAARRRLHEMAGGQAQVDVDMALRRTTLRTWLDEQVAQRAARP